MLTGVLEMVSPLQIRRDANQRTGADAVVPPERHFPGSQATPAVYARRLIVEDGRAVFEPRAVLGRDARTAHVRVWGADVVGEELHEGQHLTNLVPLERLRHRRVVLGFDLDVHHRRLRHRPGGHHKLKPKRLQLEVVLPVPAREEVRGVVDVGHARRRQLQGASRARVALREVRDPRRAPPLFEVERGLAGDAPQGVERVGRFGAGAGAGAGDDRRLRERGEAAAGSGCVRRGKAGRASRRESAARSGSEAGRQGRGRGGKGLAEKSVEGEKEKKTKEDRRDDAPPWSRPPRTFERGSGSGRRRGVVRPCVRARARVAAPSRRAYRGRSHPRRRTAWRRRTRLSSFPITSRPSPRSPSQ